jgi:hypothetical protein
MSSNNASATTLKNLRISWKPNAYAACYSSLHWRIFFLRNATNGSAKEPNNDNEVAGVTIEDSNRDVSQKQRRRIQTELESFYMWAGLGETRASCDRTFVFSCSRLCGSYESINTFEWSNLI